MRCGKCRKRMVGTAAHGRLYRYRYYICNDRQKYGRHGCSAGRLVADRTEAEVVKNLLRAFGDGRLVANALAQAAAARAAARPNIEQQRAVVDTDVTRTEQTIKRYQLAFEVGTMPAEDCGPRLQELAAQLRDLRARAQELDDELSNHQPMLQVSDEVVAKVRARIEQVMEHGSSAEKKALLKECIDELSVEGNRVYPRYRLPMAGVRIVGTMVGRSFRNANQSLEVVGPSISLP